MFWYLLYSWCIGYCVLWLVCWEDTDVYAVDLFKEPIYLYSPKFRVIIALYLSRKRTWPTQPHNSRMPQSIVHAYTCIVDNPIFEHAQFVLDLSLICEVILIPIYMFLATATYLVIHAVFITLCRNIQIVYSLTYKNVSLFACRIQMFDGTLQLFTYVYHAYCTASIINACSSKKL